ncbi:hypothetical protein ACJX0J_021773, partial [Zea mays]
MTLGASFQHFEEGDVAVIVIVPFPVLFFFTNSGQTETVGLLELGCFNIEWQLSIDAANYLSIYDWVLVTTLPPHKKVSNFYLKITVAAHMFSLPRGIYSLGIVEILFKILLLVTSSTAILMLDSDFLQSYFVL